MTGQRELNRAWGSSATGSSVCHQRATSASIDFRFYGGRRRCNAVRTFGKRLRQMRLVHLLPEAGLSLCHRGTQRTLARWLHVSPATICRDVQQILREAALFRAAGPAPDERDEAVAMKVREAVHECWEAWLECRKSGRHFPRQVAAQEEATVTSTEPVAQVSRGVPAVAGPVPLQAARWLSTPSGSRKGILPAEPPHEPAAPPAPVQPPCEPAPQVPRWLPAPPRWKQSGSWGHCRV